MAGGDQGAASRDRGRTANRPKLGEWVGGSGVGGGLKML